MSDLERAIEEAVRARAASAWESGFLAGQFFGEACAKFDPQWDHSDCEPSRPENPYRRVLKAGKP